MHDTCRNTRFLGSERRIRDSVEVHVEIGEASVAPVPHAAVERIERIGHEHSLTCKSNVTATVLVAYRQTNEFFACRVFEDDVLRLAECAPTGHLTNLEIDKLQKVLGDLLQKVLGDLRAVCRVAVERIEGPALVAGRAFQLVANLDARHGGYV